MYTQLTPEFKIKSPAIICTLYTARITTKLPIPLLYPLEVIFF